MKRISMLILLGVLLVYNIPKVSALESQEKSFQNKNNVTVTEENFLGLMDKGYSIDEIYNMTSSEYTEALEEERDVAIDIKYVKTTSLNINGVISTNSEEITEAEFNSSQNSSYTTCGTNEPVIGQGSSETTYKKLIATVYTADSITKRVKAYLYWKTIPTRRSVDIIGAGHSPRMYRVSSPVFRQLYTYGGTTYVGTKYTGLTFNTGVGAIFELPMENISTLCQEVSYLIGKDSEYTGVTTTGNIGAGDYAHATKVVSLSSAKNFTMNHATGLVLNQSITNSYDSMPLAQAYFSW